MGKLRRDALLLNFWFHSPQIGRQRLHGFKLPHHYKPSKETNNKNREAEAVVPVLSLCKDYPERVNSQQFKKEKISFRSSFIYL